MLTSKFDLLFLQIPKGIVRSIRENWEIGYLAGCLFVENLVAMVMIPRFTGLHNGVPTLVLVQKWVGLITGSSCRKGLGNFGFALCVLRESRGEQGNKSERSDLN